MSQNENSGSGVRIGNVGGSISNSIIAGGDVSNATITVGGKDVPVDKEPTVEELQQLLTEVTQELTELVGQEEALKLISAATPYTAKGAEENLKDVASKVKPELDKEESQKIGERLKETGSMLSTILDGAKNLIEKSVEVGESLKPVMDKLGPVIDRIGVLSIWASRLWL